MMSAVARGTASPAATTRKVEPLTADSARDGVLGRFQAVLAAQPEALAVTDGDRQWTFAQVAVEAGRTLTTLRTALTGPSGPGSPSGPVEPGEPVALLHSHDAGAVSSLLALLASGHPVVVLDPRTPPARLATLLERVDVRVCLSDPALTATARGLVDRVVTTPGPGTATADDARALFTAVPDPAAPAVLAFTSGSTGRPKVVVNDHRLIVRDAWITSTATGTYGPRDVIAHTLPMAFHAGLMVTVAGLLVGATMKLYDVRGAGIGALAGWLAAEEATVMHASPAILRAFVATAPDPRQLTTLRTLTVAGEAVYGRDVEAVRALLPAGATIRNRYGSSETGTISEFVLHPGDPVDAGALPTGHVLGDGVLTLVGPDGTAVEPGEAGTVTVTAPYTALGYRGDDAATAAAFTDNPDGTRTYTSSDLGRQDVEGRLHLLGRRDHSIKIRGYLVEPGEVDAALHALPDVQEAVVVGSTRAGDGLTRLVAYVVSSAQRPAAAAIRAALHQRLPGYMVPETIVFLEALPRTDRGKLDRSALPAPPTARAGARAEHLSEWESIVAAVWEQVLSLEVVGPDDDFFELGGDSLAAERLMAALVLDLGVPAAEARTALLAEAPTLSAFSRRLRRRPAKGEDLVIALQPAGARPPLFLVAGAGGLGVGLMPLAKHLGPQQPTYALQAHALERRGVPDWSVRAAARRHVRNLRRIQPEGPYHVGGHSFGGLVALEIAHQLRDAGEEVALLVVLDSFPPDPASHPTPGPMSPARRLRDALGLLSTGVVATPGLGQYWRFHRQSMTLSRRYRCAPWSGRTLVVVADSPEREARASWAPHLSGPWRSLPIGADHLSMMREPYAGQIADAITEELRRAAGEPVG
jgi:acyl-coenzyme A synthetase/AMP-(fatty) acid ligase/thioesterase domain-containing protein